MFSIRWRYIDLVDIAEQGQVDDDRSMLANSC